MTDYRDINRPVSGHNNPYELQRSGSGVGGIIIAIAVVVIVFLGLSLLSGTPTQEANNPAAVESQSATGAITQETAPATTNEATPQPAPATTTD